MIRLPVSIVLTFLCLVSFLSARSAAVSTSAAPSCDQEQRTLIEGVIKNQLSSDQCKIAVQKQNSDPNQDLQQACSTLETMKNKMPLFSCNMADYEKLHKVICEFSSTDMNISCIATTTQSTEAVPTTTASAAMTNDQKQRDLIQCVIKNQLSNDTCKSVVKNYISNDQSLQQACVSLEKGKNRTGLDGCSDGDYVELHKVICEYNSTDTDILLSCTAATSTTKVEATTTSSVKAAVAGEQKQRALIDCVIDNQLSNEVCKTKVKAIVSSTSNQDLKQACALLESSQALVPILNCTQDDYDKLHTAICGFLAKTDEEKQRALIECVIDNELSSATCTQTVKIANSDPTRDLQEGCLLLESLQGEVSKFGCTTDDYDRLHQVICWEVPVDPDSRQGRVEASIKVLSDTCERTMGSGIQELSEPSEKSCKILEDRKDHLISSGACTEIDYVRLYLVVCSDRDSEGDQQIEKVVSFLSNNLTISCHDRLWPKVESLAHGLETMCEDLKTKGPILLRVGDCSKTEYNKLDSLLCPRPMSEQEKAQRAEIDRVVAEDVTPSCKSTMEGQIESQRNNPLEESCGMIRDSKDILGSFCTSGDIVKLENAICGEGGDSASALAGSFLAIVPLCVMSWVSTYVLM